MQSDYKQNWINRENKITTGEGGRGCSFSLNDFCCAKHETWGSTDVLELASNCLISHLTL